jgi:hypothetical protein
MRCVLATEGNGVHVHRKNPCVWAKGAQVSDVTHGPFVIFVSFFLFRIFFGGRGGGI